MVRKVTSLETVPRANPAVVKALAVLSEVAAGALAEVTITEVDENASSAVAKVILLGELVPFLARKESDK